MKNTEIEIQVKVEEMQPLLDFLDQNASFKEETNQIDEYLFPSHRNFFEVRPIKEWLRLRNSNGQGSFTYKNWYYDENGKSNHYCDEYETSVDDIEQLRKILGVLDFMPSITVDKVRKIWEYHNYEISIDSVKGLGDFVEVEYIGNEEEFDPQKITDEMVSFLKSVGCKTIRRNSVGYPFQLLYPDEVKFEEV